MTINLKANKIRYEVKPSDFYAQQVWAIHTRQEVEPSSVVIKDWQGNELTPISQNKIDGSYVIEFDEPTSGFAELFYND